MTPTRAFVLWLLALVAVFKFTTTTLSVMVGLAALIAFPIVLNLALEIRRAMRAARTAPLMRSEHLLFNGGRGAAPAVELLELLGDFGVRSIGWTQPEALRWAAAPHVVVRNQVGDRLAVATVVVDPLVQSIPMLHVWPDRDRGDEWVDCWPEAIAHLGRILAPGYGSLTTYVPARDARSALPAGFVEVGRFSRRTASGDHEEVCCLVAESGRGSKRWRRRRAVHRQIRRRERPIGTSQRGELPLGVVIGTVADVRPMTRFDGAEVAALIDRSMLDGASGSLSSHRRGLAAAISNGWSNDAFVLVRSGGEQIIGVARIDRMLTDARSCAVRIELAAAHRGRGTELTTAVGLSDRLRALDVDFLMVAVAPEFGFSTEGLVACGFASIDERPSWSEGGGFSITEWYELDLRAASTP